MVGLGYLPGQKDGDIEGSGRAAERCRLGEGSPEGPKARLLAPERGVDHPGGSLGAALPDPERPRGADVPLLAALPCSVTGALSSGSSAEVA